MLLARLLLLFLFCFQEFFFYVLRSCPVVTYDLAGTRNKRPLCFSLFRFCYTPGISGQPQISKGEPCTKFCLCDGQTKMSTAVPTLPPPHSYASTTTTTTKKNGILRRLTPLGSHSRFGDALTLITSKLSPKRKCGPKGNNPVTTALYRHL